MDYVETEIRKLSIQDLPLVARVHLLAFPDSALTQLGLEAVRRYYEWQLIGPHDVYAITAIHNGNLAGFCFGGKFNGALSGFVKKNFSFLLVKAISHPRLIFSSDFRDRLRLGLSAVGIIRKKPQPISPLIIRGNSFGILSIGVSPHIQRMGVGKQLMNACETYAWENLFDLMRLSVHKDNLQAIRFYQSMGWEKDSFGSVWNGKMYKIINHG